jgi:hypothetical protein
MAEQPLDWKTRVMGADPYYAYTSVLRFVEKYEHSVSDPAEITAKAIHDVATSPVWDLTDADLQERIMEVSHTVPGAPVISADSFPSPNGLLRFATPLAVAPIGHTPSDSEDPLHATGVLWTTFIGILATDRQPTGMVVAWPIIERADGWLGMYFREVWWVGKEIGSVVSPGRDLAEPSWDHFAKCTQDIEFQDLWLSCTHALRFLLATFAIARSEAVDTAEHHDRPSRKRAQRAGSTANTVTRITLPHRRSSNGPGTGDTAGVAAHWVRGHWRWQPVGEGRQDRRLTWVRPHVRGTVGDTPDRPGEKIVHLRSA